MFNTLAIAATAGALCWPAVSFASADYTERASRTITVERLQPKPPLSAAPAKIATPYDGYFGPIYGLTSRTAPVFIGLGGKF
jgi:hypothetical protein